MLQLSPGDTQEFQLSGVRSEKMLEIFIRSSGAEGAVFTSFKSDSARLTAIGGDRFFH